MVTVTLEQGDLEELVKTKLPQDLAAVNEILSQIKCEATRTLSEESGLEELSLENKDSNRPDLWSTEGVARALRGFLGLEKGPGNYLVAGKSGVSISVDSRLEKIRPYIGCSVVKGIRLSDAAIRGLMHLQDKLDQSYGRKRAKSSIGLYEFDLIVPPLRYAVAQPDEISFVPLGTDERMTLREILVKHAKGLEYGNIVKSSPVYPILLDSRGNVLSFPPIINSNDLGRITPQTHNVLVEVTGTSLDTVLNALTMVSVSLADRGGRIYSSTIRYPYGRNKTTVTPVLQEHRLILQLEYVTRILGIELSSSEVARLLRKARFGVSAIRSNSLDVVVPCYRLDVMHAVDVIEDIGIAYGLNRVKPRWPRHSTVGGITLHHEFRDLLREVMIGLGFQEVLTFTLSNPDKLYTRMNIPSRNPVEVKNPRVQTLTCLRDWLTPSLMEILSANVHVSYPQRVFEVGDCVVRVGSQVNEPVMLAALSCHGTASFAEARSSVDAILSAIGLECVLTEADHGSYLQGRAAAIRVADKLVGIVGEIHPQVLENWGIQNPAAAFELEVEPLRVASSNR